MSVSNAATQVPKNPERQLECYLVGGAVRDELLGLPIKERDWVVVGSSPDEMLALGFTPIGKDFPVFLHPFSKEEYALARTERKSGKGYKGFTVYASPEISLEEDLLRRDLSINAIAKSRQGDLIDPYGGQKDIQAKLMRHVSPAFSEDPVRILRAGRFMARYAHMGFKLAPETIKLMQTMVQNNEVDALVPERIWQELKGALLAKQPSYFFTTLRDCDALARIFPELNALFGVPQPDLHHPEIDTGIHVMMVIDRARELSDDIDTLYAALCHDLGKGITPEKYWPSHRGHEAAGVPLVEAMSARIRAPLEASNLAKIMSDQHLNMHRLNELRPQTILGILKKLDAFRKPERVRKFALACQADSQGRGGDFPSKAYPQVAQLQVYFEAARNIETAQIASAYTEGKEIALAIDRARSAAIKHAKPQIFS